MHKRPRARPFIPRSLVSLKNRLRYRFADWQFKRYRKLRKPFKRKQLLFAAYARCPGCKAGLAYHPGIGMRGYWDCSRVLTGEADPSEVDAEGYPIHRQYPFMFYEVKSEDQPSARGATTRPRQHG